MDACQPYYRDAHLYLPRLWLPLEPHSVGSRTLRLSGIPALQGMTKQDHLDRVWDIIERMGVCVLTTRFAGG